MADHAVVGGVGWSMDQFGSAVFLDGVIGSVDVPVAVLDPDLHIIAVNGSFAAAQGRDAASFAGKSYLDLRPEEDETVLRRVLATGELDQSGPLERRDPYTAGHQRRVAELAGAIATELGLPTGDVKGIHLAGIVHDIGKIAVPADILTRPGHLSPLEWEIVKTHAQVGHDIVKGVPFPWPVATMVLQHHERLDGSGYPSGLAGDDIIPGARILAVADTVEAMSSHRPYRPAPGLDVALAAITKRSGTGYDPEVVDACLTLFARDGFSFSR